MRNTRIHVISCEMVYFACVWVCGAHKLKHIIAIIIGDTREHIECFARSLCVTWRCKEKCVHTTAYVQSVNVDDIIIPTLFDKVSPAWNAVMICNLICVCVCPPFRLVHFSRGEQKQVSNMNTSDAAIQLNDSTNS